MPCVMVLETCIINLQGQDRTLCHEYAFQKASVNSHKVTFRIMTGVSLQLTVPHSLDIVVNSC